MKCKKVGENCKWVQWYWLGGTGGEECKSNIFKSHNKSCILSRGVIFPPAPAPGPNIGTVRILSEISQ